MARIFLALPSQGLAIPETTKAVVEASRRHHVFPFDVQTGHIPHCFNVLFAQAYNSREEGRYKYFAMLHSDVIPESYCFDIMVEELERVGADVLSVVIPIGDDRGLSSIGLQRPGVWNYRRLSMHEIYNLPETFSADDVDSERWLGINTGLWIFRFDRPWIHEFPGFEIRTKLLYVDGQCFTVMCGEDWGFSKWANSRGLKLFATRKVKAWHRKTYEFANDHAWGTWETDRDFTDYPEEK